MKSLAPRIIALSPGFRSISTLGSFFANHEILYRTPSRIADTDLVLAWGERPSATKAAEFAAKRGLSLLHVEDGLIRSVGLGVSDAPLSLMVDDLGLYLDASRPTRLEALISSKSDELELERARALRSQWQTARISKYNYQRDAVAANRPFVLVVDQTFGDASISAGMADSSSFVRMLEAAIDENPSTDIVLKVHPEVIQGRKRGHFDLKALRSLRNVRVLDDNVHPASLVAQAESLYVVSSQLGFEGLLWQKRVRTFGMPFYASWGLTEDDLPPLPRRCSVSLDDLVHGALIAYPRYLHPETLSPCGPEELIDWLALQRRFRARFPEQISAFRFSKWKQPFVRDFFAGSEVSFVNRPSRLSDAAPTVLWGRKHDNLAASKLHHQAANTIRLEDGFIRSVGLGADLIRPISWVQDSIGIYYDASGPSTLEELLLSHPFDDELLSRASRLRQRILDAGLTKYNLADQTDWSRPVTSQRVILVPGQVESDASIQYGALQIRQNIELLSAVRSACPDAFIIYKPHPDVVAKLRDEGKDEWRASEICDLVVKNVPMQRLLLGVDEVHTLTSLTGFEALLRGLQVVTYGQPFYAGWGLTRDMALSEATRDRRSRKLSLDHLVAATLVLYPTYVSRSTRKFTTPERALDELIAWRAEPPVLPLLRRLVSRFYRKV